MKKITLTLAGLASMLIGSSAAAVDNSISITDFQITNLQNNEVMKVNFGSSGCFHSDTASMEITRDVVRVSGQLGDFTSDNPDGSLLTKEYQLSWKERESLDRYVTWLSNQEGYGGCTTVSYFTLTRIRNDVVVAEASFFDGWCGFQGQDDMLGIGQLLYKARQEIQEKSTWTERPEIDSSDRP